MQDDAQCDAVGGKLQDLIATLQAETVQWHRTVAWGLGSKQKRTSKDVPANVPRLQCGNHDNSTCSVLFVGGTSSVCMNPVILDQGGIHHVALLLLLKKFKKNRSLFISRHDRTVKHLAFILLRVSAAWAV